MNRTRRWLFRIPKWDDRAGAPDFGPWQNESDTLLVCLPIDLVEGDPATLRDVHFHLAGAIGCGRDSGKLRRAAVAVTAIPAGRGPFHPSQAQCVFPESEPFSQAFAAYLESCEGRPGEGFADPAWRELVRTIAGGSSELAELVETVRRAGAGPCPVFFVGEGPQASFATGPIADWIDGVRRPTRRWPRRAAVVTAAFAGGLLAVAAIWALLLPAPPSLAAPVAQATEEQLDETLVATLAACRRWPHRWSASVTGATLPTGELERARDAIARARSARSHASDLETWVARYESEGEALAARVRKSTGTLEPEVRLALREFPSIGMERIDARNQRGREVDPARVARVAAAAARVLVEQAALGIRPASEVPARVEGDAIESAGLLERFGYPKPAAAIRRIAAAAGNSGFFAAYSAAIEEGGALAEALERRAGAFQTPDVEAVLAAAESAPLAELLGRWPQLDRDLRAVEQLAAVPFCGRPLATTVQRDRARAVRAARESMKQPRDLLIRFGAPYLRQIHVDVGLSRGGPFEAANWPITDPGGTGCVARVRAAPGGEVWIVANWTTQEHVVPAGHHGACTSNRAHRLLLDRGKGSVTVDGKNVHFEILEGWPEWPPAASVR